MFTASKLEGMRLFGVIVLLILSSHLLSAQNEVFDQTSIKFTEPESSLVVDSLAVTDFSVNVGLSAFTNFEGAYGFNTYVAPTWSVLPFKKFQVDIMPFASRTNYYNLPAWGMSDATRLTLDETMLQFGVYAQGTYMINEKWYAGAGVFLDTNIPESSNSSLKGVSNYGASTYVGYKFSDHFSAEVSFGVSKYPSFYMPSPGFIPMVHPRNPYNRF